MNQRALIAAAAASLLSTMLIATPAVPRKKKNATALPRLARMTAPILPELEG